MKNKNLALKDSTFQIKGRVGTLKFNRDDIRNALTGSFSSDHRYDEDNFAEKWENLK